jgi:hypothetical protein
MPPTEFLRDGFHVWFLTTLGQIGVVEREVDQFVWRRLREAAVAECSCATVDEDDSGFVEIGLWQGFVEIEDAAYGAVAAGNGSSDGNTRG